MNLALGMLALFAALFMGLALWRLILLGRAVTELREHLGRVEGTTGNNDDKLAHLRAAADRLEARAKELLEHVDLLPPKVDRVHAKIAEDTNAVEQAVKAAQEERMEVLAQWLSDRFTQLERDLYFAHLMALAQSYHDEGRIDREQLSDIVDQLSRARMEHLSRTISPLPPPQEKEKSG